MLSLAFILTVAMNGRSSLYIMDEVDAALDEQNQRRVAALVKVSASDSLFLLGRYYVWEPIHIDKEWISHLDGLSRGGTKLELESIRL